MFPSCLVPDPETRGPFAARTEDLTDCAVRWSCARSRTYISFALTAEKIRMQKGCKDLTEGATNGEREGAGAILMGLARQGSGEGTVPRRASSPASVPMRPVRLVLAGGGHAHLGVLAAWIARAPRGIETWMIASDRHAVYSGMVPGWMAGFHGAEAFRIDLAPLAARAGVRLILASVVEVNADARELVLDDGRRVAFDLLSLATGGEVDTSSLSALGDRLLPVRPMHALVARWPSVRAVSRTTGQRLIVVGGGAAGVELALAAQRALAGGASASVMLVSDDPMLLPGHAARAGRIAGARLAAAGVELAIGHAVGTKGGILLSDGREIATGCVIAATGPRAPRWLRTSGLQLDAKGFVAVGADLRSVSHPWIFAAGDIAGRVDDALGQYVSRSGVHAVRAGPVLAANLRRVAHCEHARLRHYRPRRRSLYLIATADRRAILSWGAMVFSGHWAWWLKNWIDRRFVARHARNGATGQAFAWTR